MAHNAWFIPVLISYLQVDLQIDDRVHLTLQENK